MKDQEQKNEIKQLMKLVHQQQTTITKLRGTDDCLKASFIFAQDIAKI